MIPLMVKYMIIMHTSCIHVKFKLAYVTLETYRLQYVQRQSPPQISPFEQLGWPAPARQ
jgi:hypothetical protein